VSGGQVEPPLEVLPFERAARVHLTVCAVGIPLVPGLRQQRPAPVRGQLRQVLGPVDVRDVVEHRTQDVVLRHIGVEAPHHLRDLGRVVEVDTSPLRLLWAAQRAFLRSSITLV
jgi:hypothetical protein